MKKAVLCEFGTSHDDIFYSQFEFLKLSGYETHFIGNRIFQERLKKYDNIDYSYFLDFGKGQISNFNEIIKTWKYIRKNNINIIILNTLDGTPVRNFCLFPFGNRIVSGIIHNAGNLNGNSFTFNKIIKPKIKRIYALNSYIWNNIKLNDTKKDWVYPITPVKFEKIIHKPDGEFWFVIPGLVEEDRRDYHSLFDSLAKFSPPKYIKFIFLGKYMHNRGMGNKLLDYISKLNLQDNVILFEDYINDNVFHSYLSQADLIATLIHPEKGNFKNYSTNKISGSYLISFAHKVPLFCHEHFISYDDINSSAIFYNLENMSEKILEVYHNRTILKDVKHQILSNPNFDFEFNRNKYVGLLG
jgi:hypothetical protein